MNNIDKTYTALLQDILDNGVEKETRNGGTLSVFGRQIRHKMSEGFPLLTTKKMAWKTMVTELLWFLRGDTNIQYLVQNGCHIWDGDAYKNYASKTSLDIGYQFTKEEFINKIKTDDEFAKKWGELGPIYGKQWRSWEREVNHKDEQLSDEYVNASWIEKANIDQIANLINDLKTNPDSRRLMVSAWNVGELDQMVLPPCHYGFQVYTRELSHAERRTIYDERGYGWKEDAIVNNKTEETAFDIANIPTRAISLMWNQRSVDTFLGLPFNIASYGLLLEIIAKEVNMVPDELIGNLGDVHLYSNHVEQAKEQIGRDLTCDERIELASADIHFDPSDFGVGHEVSDESIHTVCDLYGVPRKSRQPYPLPTVTLPSCLQPGSGNWDKLVFEDFYLNNYQSHPTIKAPLSN